MIRKYRTADLPKVIEIFQQNTPKFFALEEQADLEQFLEKNRENYWLIEQDGVIAGCGGIVYSEDEQIGRIAWDFFAPNFQGKGLGRQLTAFRLAEIRKNKAVKKIIVRTSQLAYSFYAKFGFEVEKIEENYWAPGLHLYDMQMPA